MSNSNSKAYPDLCQFPAEQKFSVSPMSMFLRLLYSTFKDRCALILSNVAMAFKSLYSLNIASCVRANIAIIRQNARKFLYQLRQLL